MQTRYVAVIIAVAALAAGPHALAAAPAAQSQKPAGQPPAPRSEATAGQPVNIRLELTITDQTGRGEPLEKVVSMVVADGRNGSIRSVGSVRTQGRVQINVDARPQLLPSGAVRLILGLEYNPRTLGSDAPTEWSSLNEQIGVVLEPGKPLIVSQAADPASERKISVQVRATPMK
jgi:hypothetical protein